MQFTNTKVMEQTEGSAQRGSSVRDISHARTAFGMRDVDASRAAHCCVGDTYGRMEDGHDEHHNMTSGEYLKAFVFGGLDGIVTIFAIVAGCVGAQLTPLQIIMVGLGNLLADAVSMGFGEYASAKAEDDFVFAEKEREEWEVENCPQEEKDEMVEIYTTKYGFTDDDAQKMVDIAFKYQTFFIQHMMVEELGLMTNNDGPTPVRRGAVMFVSFTIFGMVPLAGFMGWMVLAGTPALQDSRGEMAFGIAILVSLMTLFVLGVFKGRFVGQNPITSGALMVINGAVAGGVAYFIGAILQHYVGSKVQ